MQTNEWTTSAPEVYLLRQRTPNALLNAEHADALQHPWMRGDSDSTPTEGSPERGHAGPRRSRLFHGPTVPA